MTQGQKQWPDPESFQDPLENYNPKTFGDALEQAMAEQTAAAIQSTPYTSVTPKSTVAEAIKKLAGLHVACLLVEENGKLAGVFSDRDVLDKVALEYDAVKSHPVSEFMTKEPVFVYESDAVGAILAVMAVSGYRHVPILNMNKEIVGIVSPQRITEYLSQFFSER